MDRSVCPEEPDAERGVERSAECAVHVVNTSFGEVAAQRAVGAVDVDGAELVESFRAEEAV